MVTIGLLINRGIKHDFPFISIRNVSREELKTEGEAILGYPGSIHNVKLHATECSAPGSPRMGRSPIFQHFPRDLANVDGQNYVWSL